jgi:hypothetical protein
MTRAEFVRQEAERLRRFMNSHAEGDFSHCTMPVYSRSYRCQCGFRCRLPGEFYDHVETCEESRQP